MQLRLVGVFGIGGRGQTILQVAAEDMLIGGHRFVKCPTALAAAQVAGLGSGRRSRADENDVSVAQRLDGVLAQIFTQTFFARRPFLARRIIVALLEKIKQRLVRDARHRCA